MRWLSLIVVLMLLVGCGPHALPSNVEYKQVYFNSSQYVLRYVDEEAGVVCWIYEFTNTGGISCLPIQETKLRDR